MSTFGSSYRITTFGESHCKGVGVIVDGCPPGLALTEADVQPQLSRRRPGQSNLTTPRDEKDKVTILSGTEKGFTLGTPICMTVPNEDQRPHDYSETDLYPRPSHADYTYLEKYGVKASSGGGRSSARETIGRVAAAAVAEKYLKTVHNIEVVGFVNSVGHGGKEEDLMKDWGKWWELLENVQRSEVDSNEVRCPDKESADRIRERVIAARDAKDSIGGTVVCVIRNLPTGLGEPFAHAMLSIPATKSFEIGSGLAGTNIPGHLHNDAFYVNEQGKLRTKTNFSGGIQGGITNGETVYFKVGFKPPATIGWAQPTATYGGKDGILEAKGRHDPSMATLVVMDLMLAQAGRRALAVPLVVNNAAAIPPILRGELGSDGK
ncbi:chorismate synthase [Chytridium lagenaria]|nr:chorismate synthase [Chytridium lagenaria]